MGKHEQLGERIAELAAHLDAATHRLMTDLRAFDQSGEWHQQGHRTCAGWLSWRVGWDTGTAREHVRVANRLGELPLIDEALRRGELSYSKIRAMTRVATPANEAALLEDARFATGVQMETLCRKYAAVVRAAKDVSERDDERDRYMRRRDLENGMVKIEVILHADEAETLWTAVTQIARAQVRPARVGSATAAESSADARATSAALAAAKAGTPIRGDADDGGDAADGGGHANQVGGGATPVGGRATIEHDGGAVIGGDGAVVGGRSTDDTAPPRFNRVNALLEIAQGVLRGAHPNRSPTELVVTVPADVLLQPASADVPIGCMGDGTCVSAETVRRLSCDCGVVYLQEDARGNTVSVGRKTRSISGALKRALLNRDRTCRFPGCSDRVFLEGHHIQHWADGGATSLDNVVGVCSHHHRFVHEYGYRVELDAQQTPRFFDAQGRLVPQVPCVEPASDRGWPAITAQHRELAITSETSACGWDGVQPNYGWIIDGLVLLDRL